MLTKSTDSCCEQRKKSEVTMRSQLDIVEFTPSPSLDCSQQATFQNCGGLEVEKDDGLSLNPGIRGKRVSTSNLELMKGAEVSRAVATMRTGNR